MTSTNEPSRQAIILQAALQCFLDNGYENTSIEDIRQLSGASVGSIYHHFGSKARIASHLYIEGHKNKHQHIVGQLIMASCAETTLKTLITAYIDWTKENQGWAKFLLTFHHSVMPDDLATHEQDQRQHFTNNLLHTINQYVEDGKIKKMTSELYVPVIFGPIISVSRDCLVRNSLHELEQHGLHLAEAAWQALR